jgi:hypothetical protein
VRRHGHDACVVIRDSHEILFAAIGAAQSCLRARRGNGWARQAADIVMG